jgi:hypothetical protein
LIDISFVVAKCYYRPEIHDEIKRIRNAGSLMLYPKYLTYKGTGLQEMVISAPHSGKVHDLASKEGGLVDVGPQVPEVQGKGENIEGCCCRDSRPGMFPG